MASATGSNSENHCMYFHFAALLIVFKFSKWFAVWVYRDNLNNSFLSKETRKHDAETMLISPTFFVCFIYRKSKPWMQMISWPDKLNNLTKRKENCR